MLCPRRLSAAVCPLLARRRQLAPSEIASRRQTSGRSPGRLCREKGRLKGLDGRLEYRRDAAAERPEQPYENGSNLPNFGAIQTTDFTSH